MGVGQEGTEESSSWEPSWTWPPLATHPSHPSGASPGFSLNQTQVHPQCCHFKFVFELEYSFSLLGFGKPCPPLKDCLFRERSSYPSSGLCSALLSVPFEPVDVWASISESLPPWTVSHLRSGRKQSFIYLFAVIDSVLLNTYTVLETQGRRQQRCPPFHTSQGDRKHSD